jgi:hypothetical protein
MTESARCGYVGLVEGLDANHSDGIDLVPNVSNPTGASLQVTGHEGQAMFVQFPREDLNALGDVVLNRPVSHSKED